MTTALAVFAELLDRIAPPKREPSYFTRRNCRRTYLRRHYGRPTCR